MSNAELNPLQACAEFERDPDATYVDVRAVAEFAVRHPKTARVVNVPIVFFHPTTKATHPNDSFAIVMNDVFAKDARLIVGAFPDTSRFTSGVATCLQSITCGMRFPLRVVVGNPSKW